MTKSKLRNDFERLISTLPAYKLSSTQRLLQIASLKDSWQEGYPVKLLVCHNYQKTSCLHCVGILWVTRGILSYLKKNSKTITIESSEYLLVRLTSHRRNGVTY